MLASDKRLIKVNMFNAHMSVFALRLALNLHKCGLNSMWWIN